MSLDKEIRKLPVRLTRDEYDSKAQELSAKLTTMAEMENALKSVQKNMKSQIEDIKELIGVLTKTIRNRTEDRDVECYEVRDEDRMVMQIIRCDTSEIVETRAMSPSERQLVMFPSRPRAVENDTVITEEAPDSQAEAHPDESAQTATGEVAPNPVEEVPFE